MSVTTASEEDQVPTDHQHAKELTGNIVVQPLQLQSRLHIKIPGHGLVDVNGEERWASSNGGSNKELKGRTMYHGVSVELSSG